MELTVIFEAINVLLLLFLLSVYVQNYREMKTNFCLGLIVFAAVLLLHNLLGVYFHFAMGAMYSQTAMMQENYLSAVQTVALLFLSYVTWKE